MKRTVSRSDIALKVSENQKDVIADVIPQVERSHQVDLHSMIYADPSGMGYVVACVQGLKTPAYKFNDAIFDLSKCLKSVCKLQTAVINRSTCMLDEAHEQADIDAVHKHHFNNLITVAEEDDLFDGKPYAGVPKETVEEILAHAEDDPYDFLDDDAMAKKFERAAKAGLLDILAED